MKGKLSIVLAFALVLSFAASLSASEVNFYGNFDFFAGYSEHKGFTEDSTVLGDFEASRELKLYSEFAANENIKAVMSLQFGESYSEQDGGFFGTPSAPLGGEAAANSALELDNLYLDFNWPGTEVNFRIGNQYINGPDGVLGGSNIISELPAAVVMNAPVSDMASFTLGWTRLNSEVQDMSGDKEDLFWVTVPVNTEMFSVEPYFAYASIGENVYNNAGSHWDWTYFDYSGMFQEVGAPMDDWDDDATIYYAGMKFGLNMLDPIGFKTSINYGDMDFDTVDGVDQSASGFLIDMLLSYKMDNMTAELLGSWSEGPDADDEDADIFPSILAGIYTDTNFFDGSLCNDPNGFIGHDRLDSASLWLVGGKLKDIKFMDKLTNEIQLLYIQGTAEDDIFTKPDDTLLNEDESAVVVNFNTNYQLYENLAAVSEIGYTYFDEDSEYDESVNSDVEDQFKAFAGLRYTF